MLKSKIILTAVKFFMWILGVGIGIWYLSSSINGDGVPYSSLNNFMVATGACENGVCDISQMNGCFLCPFVKQLFNVIGMATTDFWNAMVHNLWILIALGFVIFLFVHTWKTMLDANKENIKMDSSDRKFDFKKWFDAVWKQGVRVLLIGALLGAVSFGGSSVLRVVSDITIRPVMYVGAEMSMLATGATSVASCPAITPTPDDNVIGAALKPFMCVVGNANAVILAGASSGFAMMNLAWMDMGGGIFTWVGGLIVLILFLFIGFNLLFDILNIIFRLVFIIIFLPVIVASYAFENVWGVLKGAVGKCIEILINCAVRTIAVTLKVLIIYTIIALAADTYFPGPVDGYSAILPPDFAGMNASPESGAASIAAILTKCEKISLNSDGVADKDKFASCFQIERANAPYGAFDFMDNTWEFLMMMIGLYLIYKLVISKKIDQIFVGDKNGTEPLMNIGKQFKSFGTAVWNTPSGLTKYLLDVFGKKK
ncbi:MAG: hypothetical protein LBL75_01095 [Rickettsiales bacterium]|jgi:hypothetical protein|nr:hypothetical protein [Rickettsiales bacterium]